MSVAYLSAPPPRRGRPATRSSALATWANGQGRFTMGQFARAVGWPVRDANNALYRAQAAGWVRQCGSLRTPDAKRPVALYEPAAIPTAQEPSALVPLDAVMRAWR